MVFNILLVFSGDFWLESGKICKNNNHTYLFHCINTCRVPQEMLEHSALYLKAESIERGAFCSTFDLHQAIIGLENQFLVFLRVAILHRFYCKLFSICQQNTPKDSTAVLQCFQDR